MNETINPGAISAQEAGARLYHLEICPISEGSRESYYFPTIEALKMYVDACVDFEYYRIKVYIMQIGENGNFVDAWYCLDIDML